jgi:hypothetical protein
VFISAGIGSISSPNCVQREYNIDFYFATHSLCRVGQPRFLQAKGAKVEANGTTKTRENTIQRVLHKVHQLIDNASEGDHELRQGRAERSQDDEEGIYLVSRCMRWG